MEYNTQKRKEAVTLFTVFYRLCHVVGIGVLRLFALISYGCRYAVDAVYELGDSLYERLLNGRGRNFGNLSVARSLFDAGRSAADAVSETARTFRANGAAAGLRKTGRDIGHFFVHARRALAPVFSVVAPIVAILICVSVIRDKNDFSYGIEVTFKGKSIGVVEDEAVFDRARTAVAARVENATGETYYVSAKPSYRVVALSSDTPFASEADMEDGIIAGSPELFRESTGLYVNDTLVAVNDTPDAVQAILDRILAESRASYESMALFADLSDTEVTFVDKVELREGLYPVTGKKTVAQIDAILCSVVSDELHYTVVSGDAPKRIASKFGISTSDLYALNPKLEDGKNMPVGMDLIVSTEVPYLQTKLVGTVVYEEETKIPVKYIESNSYYLGVTKTKSEGEAGLNRVTAQVVYVSGIKQNSKVLETEVLKEAVPKQVYQGTKTGYSLASLKGTYIRPVEGGYISSRYGVRTHPVTGQKSSFHSGLDLCVPKGTPIHAAASGTVIYMSYMGTYGNLVKIDHGGGVVTFYAHCNNFASGLKVGDHVTTGQTIAYVGKTGRVTGPHLHFEIRYKNETVNINGLFPK